MKLIFCIDNNYGMMFLNKRQSQDSILRKWIVKHTAGSKLWMSSYSAKQFASLSGFIVDDNYAKSAAEGDYCFVEDKEYILSNVSEIILCRWNRDYPADRFLELDLEKFELTDSVDIVGSSHDKITIEIYTRI